MDLRESQGIVEARIPNIKQLQNQINYVQRHTLKVTNEIEPLEKRHMSSQMKKQRNSHSFIPAKVKKMTGQYLTDAS
jgi:hypothetical protein